jgi:DNA-binding MarR family transcriptional regulator
MSEDGVDTVLRCYPQIYLSCHVAHRRAPAAPEGLSDRDSTVLAHLSEREPVTAAALARHLGIRPSSLSAILSRLTSRELIERRACAEDRRAVELRLTARGARAMRGSSVLDAGRVAQLLDRLGPDDRDTALRGLELLARAARELASSSGRTAWSGGGA